MTRRKRSRTDSGKRPSRLAGIARLALCVATSGALLRRRAAGLAERLAMLPRKADGLGRPVTIHWNDHHIPFIEAASDRDAALALGVVHGHLRLGQMEIIRRVARGRLSEVVGAIAFDLDHILRIIDFAGPAPAIERLMPENTRIWIEGYVAGINAVIGAAEQLPEEFRLLKFAPEPWSTSDVIAVGQLAGADFSWRVWRDLLPLRERADWPRQWQRVLGNGSAAGAPGAGAARIGSPDTHAFARAVLDLLPVAAAVPGSNAAAISARRSATGTALVTSDPHLPLTAPNMWLAGGLASPGFNATGLMIPGIPMIVLGRNRDAAWTGANLRAAASDLFDVSGLGAERFAARRETIAVRWSEPVPVVVRDSEFGPVVSDAALVATAPGRHYALKWMGHRPHDGLSSMLALMQIRDWDDFRQAADGIAAPTLNLLYADTKGRVGRNMAAHLPRRPRKQRPDLVQELDAVGHWDSIVTGRDLPQRFEPAEGFVATTNERPEGECAIPIGLIHAPSDRLERFRAVFAANEAITPDVLKRLHLDVSMPTVPALRDLLVDVLDRAIDRPAGRQAELVEALRGWDGVHDADSRGALAFELVLAGFVTALDGREGTAVYRWAPSLLDLLRDDVASRPRAALDAAARASAEQAASVFARYRTWGGIHRIRFAHVLAALPLVGRRYVFDEWGVGGSNDTLMKTQHGLSTGPHRVAFGADARFLADMGEPDGNLVVLLGGQDGWIGSATFADQLPLWREGKYIELPLSLEAVRSRFRHATVIAPVEGVGHHA